MRVNAGFYACDGLFVLIAFIVPLLVIVDTILGINFQSAVVSIIVVVV